MSRPAQHLVCVALTLVPLLLIAFKLSGLPGSAALAAAVSFEQLPHEFHARSLHLLFTPVGALVVVFVRLTLGIRVLGPFRSVLLAIAFQVTGALVGLAFFGLVIGVVTVLRPAFKRMRLAYFGRSAAMLSAVAGVIVLGVMVGLLLGIRDVERVAYFPVVVLTLAGDAFATALRREGTGRAIWRAGATAATALLITALSSIPSLGDALLRFPELLLAVLAGVIFVAGSLKLRLFQSINPPPPRKSRKAKRPQPSPAAVASEAGPLETESELRVAAMPPTA